MIPWLEKQTGTRIGRLSADNDGVFTSGRFKTLLKKNNIDFEPAPPHTPELNGVVERMEGVLMAMIRPMLLQSGLKKGLWAEALRTATFLKNRLPSEALPNRITPYERFTGLKPNLSRLRTFGCCAWTVIPKAGRRKLNERAEKCFFLGYEMKGYRLLRCNSTEVVHSRDVYFNEDKFPHDDSTCPSERSTWTDDPHFLYIPDKSHNGSVELSDAEGGGDIDDDISDEYVEVPGGDEESDSETKTVETIHPPVSPGIRRSPRLAQPAPDVRDSPIQEQPLRRSMRNRTKPIRYGMISLLEEESHVENEYRTDEPRAFIALVNDDSSDEDQKAFVVVRAKHRDPQTVKEALASPEACHWKEAMKKELNNLKARDTWELVPKPHNCRNVVKNKWVYHAKPDKEGNIASYKARLVAKGFTQKEGIDYKETFAPVVNFTALRVFLVFAAHHNLELHQVDVKGAFLNGVMDREVYMTQPIGYEDEDITRDPELVCRLRKGLYGTKQAANLWNHELDDKLKSMGFIPLTVDPCIYLRRSMNSIEAIAVWVDDAILATTTTAQMVNLKKEIGANWEITDIGELCFYLGWIIERDRKEKTITISQ